MRRRLHVWPCAAVVLCVVGCLGPRVTAAPLSLPASGALVFDMEAMGPIEASGYHFVSPQTDYREARGFGWIGDGGHPFDRPRSATGTGYPATGDVPLYKLIRDGSTVQDSTFRIDLLNAAYAVTVFLGDMAVGEGRGNNGIDANGANIVRGQGMKGEVKAYTFGVTVADGKLLLRFVAEAPWKQVGVCGVTVQAGPGPAELQIRNALTITDLPVSAPDKWAVVTQRVEAVIGACAGGDTDFGARWERERAPEALRAAGLRRLLLWESGVLAAENQATLVPFLRRIGFDGFCVRSDPRLAEIGTWLAPQGMIYTVIFAAEVYPSADRKVPDEQLNVMQDRTGARLTLPNVYSNLHPGVHEAFRQYLGKWACNLEQAAAVILDEPRGCFFDGTRMGDFSAAAEAALRKWGAENGYPGLAERGFPKLEWSNDAYGLYRFRLESVPSFLNALRQAPALAGKDVYPGNGSALTMTNHHCVRPDIWARRGLQGVQWLYIDPPFRVKYCVEMMVAAGNKTDYWCAALPGWRGYENANPPYLASLRLLSGLSALPDRVTVWGMGEVMNDPVLTPLFLDLSRLVRATSGFTHQTGVYCCFPISLTYPDLVNFGYAEGKHGEEFLAGLYDANVDFKVSYDLGMPLPALALYTAIEPVLTDEEWRQVEAFLRRGGVLAYAAASPPLGVDHQPLAAAAAVFAGLGGEPQASGKVGDGTLYWYRSGIDAAGVRALATQHGVTLNPTLANPALRSFAYTAGNDRCLLLANADTATEQAVALPFAAADALHTRAFTAGQSVTLPPGGGLLLRQTQ